MKTEDKKLRARIIKRIKFLERNVEHHKEEWEMSVVTLELMKNYLERMKESK